jgi:hypothetical protein
MKRIILAAVAFGLLCSGVEAGRVINLQGLVLTPNGTPISDGTCRMRFWLYDHPTTGIARWYEEHPSVAVTNGQFAVGLGAINPFGDLFFNYPNLWLWTAIDLNRDGVISVDEAFTPRERLTAESWTIEAERLQGKMAGDFAQVGHGHVSGDIIPPVSTATKALSVTGLQGRPVSSAAPQAGHQLRWQGNTWTPVTPPYLNRPPVAILKATPPVIYMLGDRPASTVLSLESSYELDSYQAKQYAFDPTGRATGTPTSYKTTPTTTVLYGWPGDYLATGWVRDAQGAYSCDGTMVSVYWWWKTAPDATANNVGQWASMALVNGRPAIAYWDATLKDLKYVRAKDPDGAQWNTPVQVSSVRDMGEYASLEMVNRAPGIAFFDRTSGTLNYVRASDAEGRTWGGPKVLDGPAVGYAAGHYASLGMVNGYPAVAYFRWRQTDGAFWSLRYVRAADAVGRGWGQPVEVAVTEGLMHEAAGYCSLAIVNGRPAIAFHFSRHGPGVPSKQRLYYVRANDANGTSWGNLVTLDTEEPGWESCQTGLYASLAVVNGRPAIAYRDELANDLLYVRANNADGTSWGAPVTASWGPGGYAGQWASLAIVNGRPAIAYCAGSYGQLAYVCAKDPDGVSWGNYIVADKSGDVGWHASLVAVGGRPAIAYYDATNGNLCYTILRHE